MKSIQQVVVEDAPKPLGNYSHAVIYGELVFVSGMASRDFKTNEVPGLKLDSSGKKIAYDITAETEATLSNLKIVLEASGSDINHVLEIQTFLLHMEDFAAYNKVFARYFSEYRPARTTIGVASLPGNIAIEMKAIAAVAK